MKRQNPGDKPKLKKKHKTENKKDKSDDHETVAVDKLNWKPVEIEGSGLNDYEGFFGLEEVGGIGVEVIKGKAVFKQKKDKSGENAGAEIKENMIDQDLAKTRPKGEKKNLKSKLLQSTLLDIDFSTISEEPEEIETPDEWGLSLSQGIRKALRQLNFSKPTEIQSRAIPAVIEGKDIIGKAATGSGKTLAYGIPILENHFLFSNSEEKKTWPTGLVIAPTRELVQQISNHISEVAKFCQFAGTGVVPISGGLSIQKQLRLLEKNPAVVVATPGRFYELLSSNKTLAEAFVKTEMLVLDEADRLIQDGHFEELEQILDVIGRGKKSGRQTLVFSATFQLDLMKKLTSYNKKNNSTDLMALLKQKLDFKDSNPQLIDVNPAEAIAKKVTESVIECGNLEKDVFLYYFLLSYPSKTLVFVNNIDAVKRISSLLRELNLPVVGLHSEMIQKQRLRCLEKFKANPNGILIATDVAARGLDITAVQHVVHYHLPRSADMYVHRSGRTARAGQDGLSVVLCSPDEVAPLHKLQRMIQSSMKPMDVEYEIITKLKPRIELSQKLTQATKITTQKQNNWFKEAADDLGVDLDDVNDEPSPNKKKSKNEGLDNSKQRILREELKEMLAKPIGFGGKYLTRGGQNIGQLVTTGSGHEHIIGRKKTTALEQMKKH